MEDAQLTILAELNGVVSGQSGLISGLSGLASTQDKLVSALDRLSRMCDDKTRELSALEDQANILKMEIKELRRERDNANRVTETEETKTEEIETEEIETEAPGEAPVPASDCAGFILNQGLLISFASYLKNLSFSGSNLSFPEVVYMDITASRDVSGETNTEALIHFVKTAKDSKTFPVMFFKDIKKGIVYFNKKLNMTKENYTASGGHYLFASNIADIPNVPKQKSLKIDELKAFAVVEATNKANTSLDVYIVIHKGEIVFD